MKSRMFSVLPAGLLCAASVAVLGDHSPTRVGAPQLRPAEPTPTLVEYRGFPLAFEASPNQADSRVGFFSRGRGYTLLLAADEAVLAVRSSTPGKRRQTQSVVAGPEAAANDPQQGTDEPSVLRLKLVGANAAARMTGQDLLPGKSHYFIGKDPKKWRTNVPNYAKVQCDDVYPGIDVVYYGNQGRLEHDFVVAPGSDPAAVKLAIEGASDLRLDADGNLVARLDSGEVVLHKPTIYQPGRPRSRDGESRLVDGRFTLLAENRVGFEIGPYDRDQPLVIDPVLVYSSFLGGSVNDFDPTIAVDSRGDAYIVGSTRSTDFPTTKRAFQESFGGGPGGPECDDSFALCGDVFVTKIDTKGRAIVYSTYLGGSDTDVALGVAVDRSGSAYVTGYTRSGDFPATPGAIQTTYGGYSQPCNEWIACGDAFVAKIDPRGSALVYSTYLGGSESEIGAGIALDLEQNAYVAGSTDSDDFPTTSGSFQPDFSFDDCGEGPAGRPRFCVDGFVTKLSRTGAGLMYSSYLQGGGDDLAHGIAVDAGGSAYIVGGTASSSFPTTEGSFQPSVHPGLCPWGDEPCYDAFFMKLDAAGTAPVYSTYLGGSGWDEGVGIAVDAPGDVYLVVRTPSDDFPVTPGAFQEAFGGGTCDTWYGTYCSDVAVAKIDPSAEGPDSLVYSTYLGGDREENPWSAAIPIAVDRWGNVHVGGFTWSANFPIVNPLQATSFNAPDDVDAFLTKLNASGTDAIYSTYLGGNSWDSITGVALDPAGNAYVTGLTNSWIDNPFPTTSRAFQESFAGGELDVIVAKISSANGPSAVLYPKELQFGDIQIDTWSEPQIVALRNVGSGPLRIRDIAVVGRREFQQWNDCGEELPGAATCTITVDFRPRVAGDARAHLAVFDNAAESPQMVPLYGSGVQ